MNRTTAESSPVRRMVHEVLQIVARREYARLAGDEHGPDGTVPRRPHRARAVMASYIAKVSAFFFSGRLISSVVTPRTVSTRMLIGDPMLPSSDTRRIE